MMEGYCEELLRCLPAKDEEARNVIHRIAQFFQQELTSEDRDYALHLLFEEEKGIGSFVSMCITNKFFYKIVSEVFLLLSYLVDSYRNHLDVHILKVKDICSSWIKNPTSSDSKDKALDTLIAIIRSGTWSADLDVSSLLSLLISKAFSKSKIESPTVLRKIYTLMGDITELFPDQVHLQTKSILRIFLKELKHQTCTASKVEYPVIEGCFEGLGGYLSSFTLDSRTDSEICKEICDAIKKVIRNQGSFRQTAHRAGLNIISKHGEQFASFLVADYQEWHCILSLWLDENKDARAAAKGALLTLYKVVAGHISTSTTGKDLLNFFIEHFKKQFASSKDMDIAIKGFGLFSKPCKLQTPDKIPEIFNLLAKRAEEACTHTNQHKLIDYLESLTALIVEFGAIHSVHLSIIEGLSVHLIKAYPLEDHPDWETAIVNSIIVALLLLSRYSGMIMNSYLNTIVYQGLLRTVSHPVLQDVALLKETGQKIVTFENYLPLWKGLVTLNISGRTNPLDYVGVPERKHASSVIFDKIMKTFVEIIQKLDLSVKDTSDSDTVLLNDVEKCMEALHPQDFTVLVNLVDFINALLNGLPDLSCFDKWISPLIEGTIKFSIKNPLVSSFYKVLANVVKIATTRGYFEQEDIVDVEWRTCMNLLSGFLYDVILRQSQYKGDLQVACLNLMLATPSSIASTLFPMIISAFESVFHMGSSMLYLAKEGLLTLIRWNQEIPKEKMKPLLKKILPMLDRFLQTKNAFRFHEDEDEAEYSGMDIVRKVITLSKKRKKSLKHTVKTHSDTELGQLQTEIIMFLCSLDSDICAAILNKSEERLELMSWQKEKYLDFALPYSDIKIPIQLDDLLPRVSDLALHCSDRQARSSACELLQAVIMFMLGKEKQLESARQGQLTDLWKHLFPIIFRLACDADLLISQLYEPLGKQLAHWYSSKIHIKSPQAGAFLEALLDGITHDTDAALRDYSAICLREYVDWSRKQGDVHEKVAPLLKRMVSLCQHPSSQKRMGAALAFNATYMILRENRKVMDEFWLELLHSFVTALSLCSITCDETQTEKQIERSLCHILRVLMERATTFNISNDQRRVPKDFAGSTLWHAVRWLLAQCTDVNLCCRRKAMELVGRLAPHIPGCRSINDMLEKVKAEEGAEAMMGIIEGTHCLSFQLSDPTLSWDKAMKWVHALLAGMEVCIWLIDKNISFTTFFDLENSLILSNISSFLLKVIESPVLESSLWRPKAIENFSTSKCTCIVRMIEFLTTLLKQNLESTLKCIFNKTMWDIITYCTFWPSHIGFDTSSKTVVENLPCVMEDFLVALSQCSDKAVVNGLKECLKNHALENTHKLLLGFPVCIYDDKVDVRLKDLVVGLKIYHKIFKDADEWSGLTPKSIYDTVFAGIVRKALTSDSYAPAAPGPAAISHAGKLFSLAFCMSNENELLISLTCDSTPLHQGALQGQLSHGEHFVITFESILTKRILEQPDRCVKSILVHLSNQITPDNLSIIPALLRMDFRKKSKIRDNLQKLVMALLDEWKAFAEWASNDTQREDWLISILNLVVKLEMPSITYRSFNTAQTWILERLAIQSIPLKNKINVISLLPLVSACGETINNELKRSLQAFKDAHFPLYSREFQKGSEAFSHLVKAVEELLKSAQISGSMVILLSTLKIMISDPHHPCYGMLPASLHGFMNRLKKGSADECASIIIVYEMFANEIGNCDARLRILTKFLLPLINHASTMAQNKFAEKIICKLTNNVHSPLNVRPDDEAKAKQTLVTRIGSWNILQLILGFSSRSRLEEKGSELVKAALEGKGEVVSGRELILLLTKTSTTCMSRFSEIIGEDWGADCKEMFRLYFCAIYNMLATLLCNLKTSASDGKFYEKLLFTESRNSYIWRNMIDNCKNYAQPFEHSTNLKSIKQLVSIRRQVRMVEDNMDTTLSQSLRLLGSQSAAFAGTLEADITRFDFTHSSVLAAPDTIDTATEVDSVVLESDDLNNHECMATLCAVVRHMVDSKISPAPEISEGVHPQHPPWMQLLISAMLDSTCPHNACIFILRLVLNCEAYFSPYAFHLMAPLLQSVVRHCLKSQISYLLGDLIYLFIKWSSSAPPSESHRSSVNSILYFLIENCYSKSNEVFKFHIELIRSIVDVWKQFINPPFQLLYNFLTHSDKRVAINLMAIMLCHDVAPWTQETKADFLKFLLKGLQENTKSIYRSSAETIGLSLRYFKKHDNPNQELCDTEKSFIDSLMKYAKDVHFKLSDADRFLTIMCAIHDKIPTELEALVPVVLFYLVKTIGDSKALCLSLLGCCLEHLGADAFKEMKDRGICSMLTDRSVNVQTKALQILKKLAPSLSEVDLLEVTQMISEVPTLEKEARQIAYDIALASFDQLSTKRSSEMLSPCEQDILTESKAIMLRGLVDKNPDLQRHMFSLWSAEERLPLQAPQRLLTLLDSLYLPSIEEHFMAYGVELMMEGTKNTPDYDSVVFQYGLEKCMLQNQILCPSWRMKHTIMAPMFAQTLASPIIASQSQDASLGDGFLLATQNSLSFEPTLSSSVAAESSSAISSISEESIMKSSLIFSSSTQISRTQNSSKYNYKQGPAFGSQRLRYSHSSASVDEVDSAPSGFRSQRFLGKHNASSIFSVANVRRMKSREEARKERTRKREGHVSVLRNYRIGDFPDIQLKTADFIMPLKEVAKRDMFVARKLLVSICVGIKEKLSSEVQCHYISNITLALENILQSSKSNETSVVGALLEIAYVYKLKINPSAVLSASKKSGLFSLGVLLLELQIEMSNSEIEKKNMWLSVAELYDALGERDIAHAILLNYIEVGEVAKNALQAHAEENFYSAKKLYYQAVVATATDNFYESLFECMVHLSEWKEVNRIVREQVENNLNTLWEDSWHEEKLLPRLIHSEVLNIVQDSQDTNKFLSTISAWYSDEQKAFVLKDQYCEYLSVLSLVRKDLAHARYYAKKSMTNFIEDWSELSHLSLKQREQALITVQPMAEALVFLNDLDAAQLGGDSSILLKKLESVLPAAHDSLTAWETRITYRTVFLKHLPEPDKEETRRAFVNMHLCLVEAALQQNNMIFAKKYIDMLQKKVDRCDGIIRARWLIAKCQERHLWAKSRSVEPLQRLCDLLLVWKRLDSVVGSHDLDHTPKLSISAHSTESNLCCSVKLVIRGCIESWGNLSRVDRDSANWLSTKLQLQSTSSNDVIEALENLGLRSVIHSKNMTKSCYHQNDNYTDQVAEAYLCVAQYCRNILLSSSNDNRTDAAFTKHFVQGILSAMRYGSSIARQLFPLLLQLPSLNSDLAEDFKSRCEKVPEWMFLGWVPQLLAVLDTNLSSVVMPLILRLAEKFPNAVIYPYNISKEKYNGHLNSSPMLTQSLQKLDSILGTNPAQMRFIRCLSCLTHPTIIVDYYLKEIFTNLERKTIDWSLIIKACETIYADVLLEDPKSGSRMGDIGKLFKDVFTDDFRQALCGLYRSAVQKEKETTKASYAKLMELLKQKKNQEEKEKRKQGLSSILKLKVLSPWLSQFSASKLGVDIEIPGQYHGDRKPFPERHVFVAGFVDSVQVMPSIRKPVKLTIIGSDAYHYDFLVKFGEDLRQDERVQQLFRIVNGVFRNNPHCWNRRLSLATYKVMPLSDRVGLIEWVHDTACLKDLIIPAFSEMELQAWSESYNQHYNWFFDQGNKPKCYTLGREESLKVFSKLVSTIPLDILRRAFAQRSSSAEALYCLRHMFIASYSTLCIVHWLIGVGDRHLSNCLVSIKSGHCVGIDFGHTFGTATQFLPIPELVPFRLTPHIVGLVMPFSTIGLIKETMVHCLRALQADSELLLATMQVFILEPSLDWLQFSQKSIQYGNFAVENCTWLPTAKVNQAKRKLQGVNPTVIMLEDLKSGHSRRKGDIYEALCNIIRGDPSCIRSKLPNDNLTSRQQVESLIDLATDGEILAKTFPGWQPWV